MQSNRGNVLFLLLLAIVLFAALGYAVTNSLRGGGKDASAEKAQADAAVLDNFQAEMDGALMRLKTVNNCTDAQISYETPSGSNANSNAPTDKHCHVFNPAGGNVPYRNLGLGTGCPLTTLSIGQNCNGVVYVGALSGMRLYTTASNSGSSVWSTGFISNSGISSASDGLTNTNNMLAQTNGITYTAAQTCRNLGSEWYLPAPNEFNVFYINKALMPAVWSVYWTSQNAGGAYASMQCLSSNGNCNGAHYGSTWSIRCMRRD